MKAKIRFASRVISQIYDGDFDNCSWSGPLWLHGTASIVRSPKDEESRGDEWSLTLEWKMFRQEKLALLRRNLATGLMTELVLTAAEDVRLREAFLYARDIQDARNRAADLRRKEAREKLEWWP